MVIGNVYFNKDFRCNIMNVATLSWKRIVHNIHVFYL